MPKQLRRLASPLIKVLRRLYYRRFYGTGGQLERLLAGPVESWEAGSDRGDVPLAAAAWEAQYTAGAWDFLQNPDELARYGVISTYLWHHGCCGRVLDVGCGEGVLTSVLSPFGGDVFVGLDVSAVAIERARQRFAEAESTGFSSTRFEAADAEVWTPDDADGQFDAIVFNESVYYFQRPLEGVQRFTKWLRPGGVLVVSMFETLRSAAIARCLRCEFTVLDSFWVGGAKGRWNVQILQPAEIGR